MSDNEIDKALESTEREAVKDQEIDRILSSFKLNPYVILELPFGCGEKEIVKAFRKKSLLIHPDKTNNKRAPDAFDVLKKAQSLLVDENQRAKLDEIISDARRILIREKKWSLNDERLQSKDFSKEWEDKSKELLIEEEFVKRMELKKQLEKEGELKRKREEEAELQRVKQKMRTKWEDGREERVKNWQGFLKKKKKKKRKGVLV